MSFYLEAVWRLNRNYFVTVSCRWQQVSVCCCVCTCTDLCVSVSLCASIHNIHTYTQPVSMCVCFMCVCKLREKQVWPLRRWQSDQTLRVTYKLLWPFFFFFFLSDSWLDGNKGRFNQLERVLKSAKHQEMASVEINSGMCLSSTGSKQISLFPQVHVFSFFIFFFFFKTKNPNIKFNTTHLDKNIIFLFIPVIWLWKHVAPYYDSCFNKQAGQQC